MKVISTEDWAMSKIRIQSSDSSPRRHSVLSTQSSSLSFRIADITFTIVSVDPDLKLQIQGSTQNFIVRNGIPDFTTEARWDDLSPMRIRGKKLFESGAIWQLYQNKENYIFYFHASNMGSIPYKIAEAKKDFTRCKVLLHRSYFDPDQPMDPLEYPLDELLFIHFLALGRGVEVHSCGLIDSLGRGHLFVGQSGAGKTTMARLWEGESGITVLSDDRIILRKVDGRLWMYGTPWHGEARLASPARALLTRVYFLKKGLKNEVVPLRVVESTGHLIACSFLPFYDPKALDFTLLFFEEIFKTVPGYELRFLPDMSVVDFIQSYQG
jgi:hypothetical protein